MGGYDEFLAKKGFVSEIEKPTSTSEKLVKQKKSPVHREQQKELQRLTRPLKRKMERLEKAIALIEKEQQQNKADFDIAFRQGNRLKMDTLGVTYQDLQVRIEKKMEAWTVLGEEVEAITLSMTNQT